jgi:alkylation response protein AidB-like acyl-CoA dehydrogenase
MIVDLSLSEEQRMIEDSVRCFLRERLPVERLRETSNHGAAAERACWDELAGLGVFALATPGGEGGLDLGLPEEVLIARAFGLNLASPALLAQMAAPHFTTDPKLRSALAAGAHRVALAYRTDDGAAVIIDDEGTDHILLLSGTGGRLIARTEIGSREPIRVIAETFTAERIAVPTDTNGESQPSDAHLRAALLIAAYLVGVAQAATAMAVAYAGTREQFGQPIGAFQAIKHACADMATRAAAAEAQCFHAAVTFGHGLDDAAETAATLMLASRAANENARANIQIHGGVGFTAECDAHLFLKMAITMVAIAPRRQSSVTAIVGQ